MTPFVSDAVQPAGELERICGPDRLAMPAFPYGGKGGRQRDPSPCWDVWYEEFTPTDRRRLARFMGGSLTPDVLATWHGVSVDVCLRMWRTACLAELKSCRMPPVDVDEWEMSGTREALAGIVGPQEVADRLGVKVPTVHQWRKRNLLPPPVRVISGVPLWSGGEIDTWALDTGRLGLDEQVEAVLREWHDDHGRHD